MEKNNCCCPKTNTARAFVAGFIATAVMTAVMALMGMDIMKSLGMMLMGGGSSLPMLYIAGGLIHLTVGLILSFVYVMIFARMRLPCFLRVIVFGTFITLLAFYGMPVVSSAINNFKGEMHKPSYACPAEMGASEGKTCAMPAMNPCAPEACKSDCESKETCSPCPTTMMKSSTMNPCNPCASVMCNCDCSDKESCKPCCFEICKSNCEDSKLCRPCCSEVCKCDCNDKESCKSGCEDKEACKPCPKTMMNSSVAMNPCNPCSASSSSLLLKSWMNHLIFAFVLSLVYGSCSRKED